MNQNICREWWFYLLTDEKAELISKYNEQLEDPGNPMLSINDIQYIYEQELVSDVEENPTAKTSYDLFNIASRSLTDRLREIVEAMPYKGDTSEDSQRIFLLEKLNDFERALNGVEIEDFE